MKVTQIPFQQTGFFSKTILDYLEQTASIKPFYNNYPDINGFKKQIEEKEESFSKDNRKVLVAVLQKQYAAIEINEETQANIDRLIHSNTFTVTTGHQLNLFTGPLYFLYKIISTINLAEELGEKFNESNFVPVYWMATEDHDFEEIKYFNFKNKKVQWNRERGGAVGHFDTKGLQEVFEQFFKQLGTIRNTEYLKSLFKEGYLKNENLTDATRYIANQLFSKYGLVIIDGDDSALKQLFTPFVAKEFTEQTSYKVVSKTIIALEKNYKIQVKPREINQFYLSKNSRERIILENGIYKVNNSTISWSLSEILKHLHDFPEKFSPNVIMRSLYQEVILPNLAYIGGGGELAYWLELKDYFKEMNIPFPILLLRNSVQVISAKQQKKIDKLRISHQELFLKLNTLLDLKVKENSEIQMSFSLQREQLKAQFVHLKETAKKTDISFLGAVNAQEKKQLNGIDTLEKRLLVAEKRRQQDLVVRISEIKNQLFPNQRLEERQRNFSEYYLEYGDRFIESLKEVLKPLELEFTILEL
jgi:bacillithiol biosynthesis cysteine-adding enzyme BshC